MELQLLGAVSVVTESSDRASLGGPRRQALLALLGLASPRSVSRATLVRGIWGELPPDTATNTLQAHVSALRRALGPASILTEADGYRLSSEIRVDAAEFLHMARRGAAALERGANIEAARLLTSALEMWRGPALQGLETTDLCTEAMALEEQRCAVLEQRIDADLHLGRHHDLCAELEKLVAQHPAREQFRAFQMLALSRCGRQADALAAYETARRWLADEMGLEPSSLLRATHAAVLSQERPVESRRPVRAGRSGVPALPDATIGRERDILAIVTMLSKPTGPRLVSIIGPGGVGKTRLALEVAGRVANRFLDGVVFVPLQDAQRPQDVAATIAAALGTPAGTDAVPLIQAAIQFEHLLLVCDNFDHVDDAAPVLATLLAGAPGLRILATSRRLLQVRSEQRYPLEPLAVREAGSRHAVEQLGHGTVLSPAVRLFAARAAAVDPHFTTGLDDVEWIAQICERCDGLPLAIELAVTRLPVRGLQELASELSSPLDLLRTDAQDVPPRHRSLRGCIAEGVAALSTPDQELLCQLSVFRGGFTLEAAAAVTSTPGEELRDRLETLLGRSLVQRRNWQGDGRRFDLLFTVREYLDELATQEQQDRTARRHAEYYRARLGPAPDANHYRLMDSNWRALGPERPNIRAAIRWAGQAGYLELYADLAVSAAPLWHVLGPHQELREWLVDLRERPELSLARQCDVAAHWALVLERTGQGAAGAAAAREAMALAERHGDPGRWIVATCVDIWLHMWRDGLAPSGVADRIAAVGAVARDMEADESLRALVFSVEALVPHFVGDEQAHEENVRRSLAFAESTHLLTFHVHCLHNLSEVLLNSGRPEEALEVVEKGLALARGWDGSAGWEGAGPDEMALRGQRGMALLLLGRLEDAKKDLAATLAAQVSTNELFLGLETVLRLAVLRRRQGLESEAAWLVDLFDSGLHVLGHGAHPEMQLLKEQLLSPRPVSPESASSNARTERDLALDLHRVVAAMNNG